MKEHSKEDVRLGRIVFLACIVVAMLAVTFCRGQNQRYDRFDDRDDIITISPEKSMRVPYKGSEIAFSVFVDSLSDGTINAFMYVYYPDVIKDYNIDVSVKFENNKIETLSPTMVDTMYEGFVYAEYYIPPSKFMSFLRERYSYVNFDGIKQHIAVYPNGYFFSDFFMTLTPAGKLSKK